MSIQDKYPTPRPPWAEADDCAYCSRKAECAKLKVFYEGESYPACERYVDFAAELDKEHERLEKLKELQRIKTPTPRPEGAVKRDCLYCKKLAECHYPLQGECRVCDGFNELEARPPEKPKHCFFCLSNYKCTGFRVRRDGKPCEKYKEYQEA